MRIGDWADPTYFARFLPDHEKPSGVLDQDSRNAPKTRLTKAGVVLCLLSIGIGLAAYNTSSNILYLTLALLLSSLLLSGILSWLNFQGMRWRITADPHLRVGSPAAITLTVVNAKRRLPSIGLIFWLHARLSGQSARLQLPASLGGGENAAMQWIFTPTRRGMELIEMPGVESLFPFGFLKKGLPGGTPPSEVLVWPARVEYQFGPCGGQQLRRMGGAALRRGPGAELVALRAYQHGDPFRSVHWKASARTGKLLVRETAQEQNAGFALWVGASREEWADDEQFERMCAFAGSLAEDLFRRDRLAFAGIEGGLLAPILRLADLHAFMDMLSTLNRTASTSPAPQIRSHPLVQFRSGRSGGVIATIKGEACGEA